jgi:hypothetical protein
MSCWPPCGPWCTCVNNNCTPAPVSINALRLKTLDGRYLSAFNGGGAGLVAMAGPPAQSATFILAAPTTFPLHDGDIIALVCCDSNWGASANQMRVQYSIVFYRSLYYWEAGGPGTFVDVDTFADEVARESFFRTGDPTSTQFAILKEAGGAIASGDQVSIRINNTDSDLFRLTPDGTIAGDGDASFNADTAFVVEFVEVATGIGPRPVAAAACRVCAEVKGRITDGATGKPIAGAVVTTSGVLNGQFFVFKGTTDANGQYVLSLLLLNGQFVAAGPAQICVPAGNYVLVITEIHHQTAMLPVVVPDHGSVHADASLTCTQVLGTVVDPNAIFSHHYYVTLIDADQNSSSFLVDDGSFGFWCVRQGLITLIYQGESCTVTQTVNVPPAGIDNVILQCQACQGVSGTVTDATSGQELSGAIVQIPGSQAFTSVTGSVGGHGPGFYDIACVPASTMLVTASRSPYITRTVPVALPAAGSVTRDITLLAIWNTGVDSNATTLAPGATDPHWQVISGPGIVVPQPAVVVTEQHQGGIVGPAAYFTTSDSRWIWATADGSAPVNQPYVFQLLFNLDGYDPASVDIIAHWGVDNDGAITVNGVVPALDAFSSGTIALIGGTADHYNDFATHFFRVSGKSTPNPFKAGVNSLEITVTNTGAQPGPMNPAALNVTELAIENISLLPGALHHRPPRRLTGGRRGPSRRGSI